MSIEKNFKQHPRHRHLSLDNNSGIWYFCEYIQGRGTVKRTLKTKNVKEALVAAEVIRKEVYGEKPESETRRKLGIKNPSIESLYIEFREFKKTSGKITKKSMVRINNTWDHHLKPYWERKTLEDWNQKEFLKFETWFLTERSDRVYFNIKKTIVSFQHWMFANKYIDDRVIIDDLDEVLKKRQRRERVGRVYSKDEIERILHHSPSQLIRLAIMIAVFMGPRKMEVLKLKRSDVVFDEAESEWMLKFWSDKNGEFREVAIPPPVKVLLDEVLDSHSSVWLFPMKSNREAHMSSQVFDKGWVRAKQFAGIRDWDKKNKARFHDLRHTFATMTAENNWAPKLACEILDMSLRRYDAVYTHVSRASKIRAMRKVRINDY